MNLIREDGYINATELCKKGGKKCNDWYRSDRTKSFLKICSEKLKLPIETLVQIKKGGNNKQLQGTYVHPIIATNIAQWISAEFAVNVSLWIEEWKQANQKNKERITNELNNIKPDEHTCKEHIIRDRLAKELNGKTEVECKFGKIDILTDHELIEIKHISRWKHAIGQVIAYNVQHNKKMRIHLFEVAQDYNINEIILLCATHNICVSYEN